MNKYTTGWEQNHPPAWTNGKVLYPKLTSGDRLGPTDAVPQENSLHLQGRTLEGDLDDAWRDEKTCQMFLARKAA